MLNENENIVFFRGCDQFLVVLKQFDCGLCDEYVNTPFYCVQCDGIMCGVWCKDSDCKVLVSLDYLEIG